MKQTEVAAWFKTERGITADTLRAFGVSWDEAKGNIVMPYPNGIKERPHPPSQEKRRFYFTAGKLPDLYQPPVRPASEAAFLCEGETDTMRLWQETQGTTAVFGIGGINTWRPEFAKALERYQRVFVCLDNDDDYMVKGQVDGAWARVRHDPGGKAKRIFLPQDTKDVCEFFDRYDVETLKMLTSRLAPSRFRPVDFNVPPPPVRWLLEGWIAMGDVTLLVGKGGLGKSWITMALSLAILDGHPDFIDAKVHEHGSVLYVDEENPLDVVHDRLRRLGLKPEHHAGSLRYLWNQGVKLDRDPGGLLDEALNFEPKAVFLDSLSRLHNREENAAGEIASLFNDGIRPLARETGAGVVLIHHHDKNAVGPRGSTDIVNSADAVIEVYEVPNIPGKFRLRLTKSRRRLAKDEMIVGIVDNPTDGTVALQVSHQPDPPF